MYRSSDISDINCYRDYVDQIKFVVWKNEDSGYTISSYFSGFKNLRLRESSNLYFNYSWSLDNAQGPNSFNPQSFINEIAP